MHIDFYKPLQNGIPLIGDSDMRLSNSLIMTLSKLFALASISILLLFLFTGNASLYYQILGTRFFQSLRKLLFGAYLSFPLVSRVYLSAGYPLSTDIMSVAQLYTFNVCTSFILSWIMYLFIENPLTEGLRLIISDIVRVINRIGSEQK